MQQKIGRSLTWIEQQRLLTVLVTDASQMRTLVLLQLRAGLRCGEALSLTWSCLTPTPQAPTTLYVPKFVTKAKQARTLPLSPDLRENLTATYLDLLQTFSAPEIYERRIVSTTIHPRFTSRWANYKLRTLATKAEIAPLHTHLLRHTFATNLLRVTNTRVVQLLLGHEHLSSTQLYLHPDFNVLTAAVTAAANWYERASPQPNLDGKIHD